MMLAIAETTPTHTKPTKGFRYARASDARNHYTIHNHHTNNPHTPNQNSLARADAVTGITSRNPTACWTPTTHKKGHDNNHDKHTTRHDTHCLVQSQTTPKTLHPLRHNTGLHKILRKEVIQPHLPVRLPCYDFVPIANPTFEHSPHQKAVRPCASGVANFRDVTGGVYKARERIHRSVADLRLLATPTSWGRVADPNPN